MSVDRILGHGVGSIVTTLQILHECALLEVGTHPDMTLNVGWMSNSNKLPLTSARNN